MAEDITRVAVVIDWQNCFRSAQDAFGPGTNGNVYPLALARHLAASRPAGQPRGELVRVDIHCGVPSQKQNAQSYSARRRQLAIWENVHPCVRVHPRTLVLRGGQLREKGVDVAVAINVVRHVFFDEAACGCEVVVLVCADTDQLPALELIVEERGADVIEVATWEGRFWGPQPLAVQGHRILQHRLDEKFYRSIEDATPYHHVR